MSSIRNDIQLSRRRPVGIWIIFLVYALTFSYQLFCLALVLSGAIQLPDVAKNIFASQSAIFYGFIFLGEACNLGGAVYLILLRKGAYKLFFAGFLTSLLFMVYQSIADGYLNKVTIQGAIGFLFGMGISGAIVWYSWRLAQRGILK